MYIQNRTKAKCSPVTFFASVIIYFSCVQLLCQILFPRFYKAVLLSPSRKYPVEKSEASLNYFSFFTLFFRLTCLKGYLFFLSQTNASQYIFL